jgi:hypothetical protein
VGGGGFRGHLCLLVCVDGAPWNASSARTIRLKISSKKNISRNREMYTRAISLRKMSLIYMIHFN